MRHVFIYALFSHKRKTCTNKFDFLLLSDAIGRPSVIYFLELFEVFIQLETTINCLKQGDMGSCSAFSQNKSKV